MRRPPFPLPATHAFHIPLHTHRTLPRITIHATRRSHLSHASSAIAARVAAFLPTLAAANDALAADVAAGRGDDHNVECVDEGAPHVEMDVAAGVLELGDAAAVRAAEAAVARGNDDDGPMAAQAAASSSESDSDDDGSEESNAGEVGAAPQATTKRRKRAPGITVIG